MYAMEVLKQAAQDSKTPLAHVGVAMGKTPQYVNTTIARGSTPKADNLAKMLDVCNYGLYAMPYGDVPSNALQITYEGQHTD